MNMRTIKQLGMIVLLLVSASGILFAQSAGGNTTEHKYLSLKYMQNKLCSADDWDCLDCVYIEVRRLNADKEKDVATKEAELENLLRGGKYGQLLEELKSKHMKPGMSTYTWDGALEGLEKKQYERALGDYYDFNGLLSYLVLHAFSASGYKYILDDLYDKAYDASTRQVRPEFTELAGLKSFARFLQNAFKDKGKDNILPLVVPAGQLTGYNPYYMNLINDKLNKILVLE